MYVAAEDFKVEAKVLLADGNADRQAAFREVIDSQEIRDEFESPDGLARRVVLHLRHWEAEARPILSREKESIAQPNFSWQDIEIPTLLDDAPSTADHLDFEAYAVVLSNIVERTPLKSSSTIGVFGSWGSGKTTLLRMIGKRLRDSAKSKGETVKNIEVNVWQLDSEEDLWNLNYALRRGPEEG